MHIISPALNISQRLSLFHNETEKRLILVKGIHLLWSMSGTSSGSIDSPLIIHHSLFHSRLKTFLFCKSFPPYLSVSSSGLTTRTLQTLTDTCKHICFYFPPLFSFYRAMLCIRGTSHGPVSVRLSVCLSQVGVLLKWLNVGPHKQHLTIAQGL